MEQAVGYIPRKLIPVTEWPIHHGWPSEAGLRWLVFNEHRNGFSKCVRRVGRRVLIDEAAFFQWVEDQNDANADAVA